MHLVLDAKYRLDASPEYITRYKSPGPPEDTLNSITDIGMPFWNLKDAVMAAQYKEEQW